MDTKDIHFKSETSFFYIFILSIQIQFVFAFFTVIPIISIPFDRTTKCESDVLQFERMKIHAL